MAATQTTDAPPQFDLSTAVPETDDGKAVSAMPAFDLKSAYPEESIENAQPQENLPEAQAAPLRQQAFEGMKTGIEKIPPSPASEAVRSFIENVGKGGLEQFKEADAAYSHPNETPEQAEAELNKSEIAKGVMGQLQDTFTGAIAIAAPEMSPEAWGMLGTFMGADVTRQAVQKIFAPNMTPSEKDVMDLISFPLEAGASKAAIEGMGEMIAKAFTIKGVSPTMDLDAEFLKMFAEPQVTEKPAEARQPAIENMENEGGPVYMSGGVLEKMGVTENHFDVAMARGMPVRVPIVNLFNTLDDPQWDNAREMMSFEGEGGGQEQGMSAPESPENIALQKNEQSNMENEGGVVNQEIQKEGEENANQGGESAQSGSGEETPEGQAQAGVHLRDDAQGGVEAKAGEEVTQGEMGTSKIAKSINQKAIEDKLTTGFKDLAGYEKIDVKEQAKLASDTIANNLDDARAMIRGDKPLPNKLRGISLITAMEEHLKSNPDADIAHELANSPLITETSHAAQELRLAAERTPDSSTAKLAEVKKALIDAKGGDQKVGKLKQGIAKAAKAEMEKIHLSKEEMSLDKFLKDIEC